MNDTINLNHVRKAKAVISGKTTAAQNRVKFGRSKAAKATEAQIRKREVRSLDGALREP